MKGGGCLSCVFSICDNAHTHALPSHYTHKKQPGAASARWKTKVVYDAGSGRLKWHRHVWEHAVESASSLRDAFDPDRCASTLAAEAAPPRDL